MYAKVDIDRQETKTTILIRPQKSIMFKIGLWAIIGLMLPALLIIIGIIFSGQTNNSFETLGIICLATILLIFLYKHLRGAYRKEILTIENKKVTYNNTNKEYYDGCTKNCTINPFSFGEGWDEVLETCNFSYTPLKSLRSQRF